MPSEITSNQTGNGLLGQTNGYLSLRVCGGEHGGRVLRLSSQKCTIGSGPQCTLRLRGRGFRPLHCLILRGESGIYIRRWSPDTCLNGRGFSVARLQTGDRLHIGTVEFEVLSDGSPVPEDAGRRTVQVPTSDGRGQSDPTITRLEEEVENLESQLAELQRQNDAVVSERERAGQESEAARSSVLDLQQQLETAQAALNEDRGKWESEQNQLQTQLNERTEQLEQLREELSTYQQNMDQSRQASESQSHQLTEANRQLQESHRQLLEANEQLNRELQEATRDNQQQADQQPLILELRDALAELKQQFDDQANEKQQLQEQVQAAQSHRVELEQALATAQQRLEETSQLAARVEEVTSELESARSDMESRTQKWEGQLAERKAAIQDLREQLERAGKDHEQQVAERDGIASRLAQLEQENEQLVSQIAELQQNAPVSPADQELDGSDSPEWKETVAGLQAELDRTRAEHRQAVAEWQSDRTHLEEQLAERSDKLTRRQKQHDTSMQQAEQLIYSLQQEGKQLLSQLDEAKYTLRHDAELRKQLEAAQECGRDGSGDTDQLRQTVQNLEEKCHEQEDEIGRQTVLLRSLVDEQQALPSATVKLSADMRVATNESSDLQSAAEAETHDRHPRSSGEDASDEAQPAGTLVLGSEFKQEVPDELAETVDSVAAGERPTEDRQPPAGPEQIEAEQSEPVTSAFFESSAVDDEDHIIQSYMERLLQRVGCKPQEAPNREESPVTATAKWPAPMPEAEPHTAAKSDDNAQRAVASECRTSTAEMAEDLLAMRELANRSARMAISSSDRRRVFMEASGEFGVATVSLGVSSTVIAMSPDWISVYAIGGYVGLAFGVVWTVYGLRSLFNARTLRKVAYEEQGAG